MRRIARITALVFILILSIVVAVACTPGDDGKWTIDENRIKGFETAATAKAELGEYYVFEKLNVTVDGLSVSVILSAKKDGSDVFVTSGKIFISEMGTYQAIYTIYVEGKVFTKETEITVTDTTPPTINTSELVSVAVKGQVIDLAAINVSDNSGVVKSVKFEVFKSEQENITEQTEKVSVSEDNTFTVPEDANILTVKITAKDGKDLEAVAYAQIIAIEPPPANELFNFAAGKVSDYTFVAGADKTELSIIETAALTDAGLSPEQLESLREGAAEKILKVQVTGAISLNKAAVRFHLPSYAISDMLKYDFIKLKVYFASEGEKTSEDRAFPGVSANVLNTSYKSDQTGPTTSMKTNGWFEVLVPKNVYETNQNIFLSLGSWLNSGAGKPDETANFTVYLAQITGGFDTIMYDAEPIDLTAKFSLDESEIINAKFNDVAIENVKAFVPNTIGVLTFDMAKSLTKPVSFAVDVYFIRTLNYNVFENFTDTKIDGFTAMMGADNTKKEIVKAGEFTDSNLTPEQLSSLNDGITNSAMRLKITDLKNAGISAVRLQIPSDILSHRDSFDYIQYKMYFSSETVPTNALLASFLTNTYKTIGEVRIFDNGWYTVKIPKESYAGNTFIALNFSHWASQNLTFNVYVDSITGGFNDIETMEPETDVYNILALTNLESGDITNAVFAADENATDITDLTNFIPGQAGIIRLTVNKEGYLETELELKVIVTNPSHYNELYNPEKWNINNVTAHGVSGVEVNNLIADDVAVTRITSKGLKDQSAVGFTLDKNLMQRVVNFDYFVIKLKFKYLNDNAGNAILGMYGSDGNTRNVYPEINGVKKGAWSGTAANAWHEVKFYTAEYLQNYNASAGIGYFKFMLTCWRSGVDHQLDLDIASITGGYNDLAVSDTAVDLNAKLGVAAGELTAQFEKTGGQKTDVENVLSFVPSEAGKLYVTITKDGYRVTQLIINIA